MIGFDGKVFPLQTTTRSLGNSRRYSLFRPLVFRKPSHMVVCLGRAISIPRANGSSPSFVTSAGLMWKRWRKTNPSSFQSSILPISLKAIWRARRRAALLFRNWIVWTWFVFFRPLFVFTFRDLFLTRPEPPTTMLEGPRRGELRFVSDADRPGSGEDRIN